MQSNSQQINTVSNSNIASQLDSKPPANLIPKFLFGHKGDVRKNIFFLEDNYVLYPCGHNIVIYNSSDRTQKYIPGIDGSEGITALAMTANRKLLAVCERANKAVCSVYNVQKFLEGIKDKKAGSHVFDQSNFKKKRVLISSEYDAREFLSADFCPDNDKLIATVTGKPDFKVILWIWDKTKFVAEQALGIVQPQTVNQISFSNMDPNVILVTGKELFKYYRLQDSNHLKLIHTQIKEKQDVSQNWTCHAWLPDGRFILCNDFGHILLFEGTGDYKQQQIFDAKKGWFPIYAVYPYQVGLSDGAQASNTKSSSSQRSGFIVAGEQGQIRVFYKSDSDARQPYKRVEGDDLAPGGELERENKGLYQDIKYHKIQDLALSPREDQIVFTTDANQIIKVSINLERPAEEQKYEYLISSFHSKAIYGLDVCIKKQIVATCSSDRSVRIWSYTTNGQFNLEVCAPFNDEAYSLGLHPSGFHIVVGFSDHIKMMNILDDKLDMYKEIQIAGCKEIQFSHGGHLFACHDKSVIQVFKFYSAECPSHFKFKAHDKYIKSISWLEDDSGFVSCAWDFQIFVWKLYPGTGDRIGELEQNPTKRIKVKTVQFFSVTVFRPESSFPMVYATGSDKSIREFEEESESLRYEEGVTYSQIACGYQRNILVAGVAEPDRPGSIQVFRYPFEKVSEVQAHSKHVERIKLSFDNTRLFSVGNDGVLACFNVIDKAITRKDAIALPQVHISEEILIEKKRRDDLQNEILRLKDDIQQEKTNNAEQIRMEFERNEKTIKDLEAEQQRQNTHFKERNRQLEREKEDEDRKGAMALEKLEREHEEDLRAKKREFEEKIFSDNERYQELQKQKDDQCKEFEQRISELALQQEKKLKEMKQEHELQKQQKDNESKRLDAKINQMLEENKNARKNIEDDAWERIDVIKDKNKEELAYVIEQGLKSKGELTKVTGMYKQQKSNKDQLKRKITEKTTKLHDLVSETTELRNQIESQKSELQERENTINDKDNRITDLKKKTQELEKFKFVLDYKIKELKRAIVPTELEIQKLNEKTNQMTQEVKHFHRVNNNLQLIVEDLKMRSNGLQTEEMKLEQTLHAQEQQRKRFKNDVFDCLQHINDFKKLKKGVIRLYKTYVLEENNKLTQGEGDLNREYTTNRKYLEGSVKTLRDQIRKDSQEHGQVNSRFMKENVWLIKVINELHKERQTLLQNIRLINQVQDPAQDDFLNATEAQKQLKLQDLHIDQLTQEIQIMEQENIALRSRKPARLPPIEQPGENTDPEEMGQGIGQQPYDSMPENAVNGQTYDQQDGQLQQDQVPSSSAIDQPSSQQQPEQASNLDQQPSQVPNQSASEQPPATVEEQTPTEQAKDQTQEADTSGQGESKGPVE